MLDAHLERAVESETNSDAEALQAELARDVYNVTLEDGCLGQDVGTANVGRCL